jgi:DNA-binding Lrp family transcriptional regulator
MHKINYNLLYLRSENARMGLKELSAKLRKTPQRLKYSIASMEKAGLLKEPFCVFDYSHFGLVLFRVYFKGSYATENDRERVVKELCADPYVVSVYELTGEFDLAAEFASPNPSRFNKEFKKMITMIPELNDCKIVLNLVTHIYPKNYLVSNTSLQALCQEKIVGGDREEESFTENELLVIRELLNSPTARMATLAEKAGLNSRTVKSVMKGLVKRRVIRGFKFTVDTNRLGTNKWRLFLKLHNISIEKEAALMKRMLATEEVVQINKTVGDWDMEADVESVDRNSIKSLMVQLRGEFKDIIERFNLIEFYDYYKKSYLPAFLFEKCEQEAGVK